MALELCIGGKAAEAVVTCLSVAAEATGGVAAGGGTFPALIASFLALAAAFLAAFFSAFLELEFCSCYIISRNMCNNFVNFVNNAHM